MSEDRRQTSGCSIHEAFRAGKRISLILSLVIALAIGLNPGSVVSAQSVPPPFQSRPVGSDGRRLAVQRVVRVVDGDTVILNRGGELVKCRLIGVSAPESTTKIEPFGAESTAYLKAWIEGRTVYVDYERKVRGEWERDRYGRLLVYLYADKGRQLVNLELVRRGYARAEVRYPTRYRAGLREAEQEAREQGLGLWDQAGGREADGKSDDGL